MTSETHNPADALSRVIAEGRISEDALHAMTGIQPEKLRSFLNQAKPVMTGLTGASPALSNDESLRLSVLAAHLTDGLRIGDDERLKAIFETLTSECRLTLGNIARLTGVEVDDLKGVLRDPQNVPINKKYELAIKGSYLINAVNRARDQ